MPGQITAEQRVYRTVDGQLVRENDPRGAFLAYSIGDTVPDKETQAYRDLVDGDRSGHEVPGLMHDRLATNIADAARLVGADPAGPAADAAQQTLQDAAEIVDADQMSPPVAPRSASPQEVVRQVASAPDDDRPVADEALYRTDEGQLVREGDPGAVTVAYAKGDRVEKADQDAHAELTKASSTTKTKQAAKPADKAAPTPDNK